MPLNIEYTINLNSGWNLIAYWLQESQAPADAFSSLIENGNLITATYLMKKGCQFIDTDMPLHFADGRELRSKL